MRMVRIQTFSRERGNRARTWTLSSPVYRKREVICESPANSTSPASIRGISRPPPAASAAGGRGILVSCRVHSVGALRTQAAGVLEAEARRPLFAGGGFPLRRWCSVELRRRSTAIVVLASPRRCRGRLPRAWLRGRRSQRLKNYRKILVRSGTTTTTAAGVGFVRCLAASRPPGDCLRSKSREVAAAARHQQLRCVEAVVNAAEGLSCNFVFPQGPFCNISG